MKKLRVYFLLYLSCCSIIPVSAQVPEDRYWDSRFNIPGLLSTGGDHINTPSAAVLAMASQGNDIYVGGQFASVGMRIAKWNSAANTWSPLWSGIEGADAQTTKVNAIVVLGDDVYVCGRFEKAGGIETCGIARWSIPEQRWYDVGGGINNGEVLSVTTNGKDVYIGGSFNAVGKIAARNIARWDGMRWHALGQGGFNGVNGNVTRLAFFKNELYAGGSFTRAGIDTSIKYLAKWTGAEWKPVVRLAGRYSSYTFITALTATEHDLYVSGSFDTVASMPARIARFDGSDWTPVVDNFGIMPGGGEYVQDILATGNEIYVAGKFTSVNGILARNIAKWNKSTGVWSAFGSGLGKDGVNSNYEYPKALALAGNSLFVGGGFTVAGSIVTNYIARYDLAQKQWYALSNSSTQGLSGGSFSLTVPRNEGSFITTDGSNVFAVGNFFAAGNVNVNRAAKWDGNSWSSLGIGFGATLGKGGTGLIYYSRRGQGLFTAAAKNGKLYVGGEFFETQDGKKASGIAVFDGFSWSELGGGIAYSRYPDKNVNTYYNESVSAIATIGNDVYIGGDFIYAGTDIVNSIARWDGTKWNKLGTGVEHASSTAEVAAIAELPNGDILAGGFFTKAGGTPVKNLARWNGSSWSDFGGGISGYVNAIAVAGNDVYVAGNFERTGDGTFVNHIARWDGQQWHHLDGGVTGGTFNISAVTTLAVKGNKLFAGGYFIGAGASQASYVAVWDMETQKWSPLGSGVNGTVTSLAFIGDKLYMGGRFNEAGGKPSVGIALWDGMTTSVPTFPQSFKNSAVVYPNPAHDFARVEFTALQSSEYSIELHDALGRTVLKIFNGFLKEGRAAIPFRCESLSNGMYYCTISQNGNILHVRTLAVSQ